MRKEHSNSAAIKAKREFAYDRDDKLQQFNKGWDEAIAKGWTVVSMKGDWKVVYPPGP